MKKMLRQNMASGLSLGAVIGVGIFLFNSPSEQGLTERLLTLVAAAFAGIVGGLILGAVLFFVEYFRAKKFDSYREELKQEGILRLEENASLYQNGKNVPGRLFLTDSVIVFRASREESDSCKISLDSILGVQVSDPRLCRITLTLSEGGEKTFAVVDPRAWFELLGSDKECRADSTESAEPDSVENTEE